MVRSNPKAIFPYLWEVQANLERWLEFAANDRREDIHPLIKGVWNTLYYVSVHSFLDGNGRILRILFAAHVAKHGMIPVICTDGLSREQYLKNVYSASTRNPHPWCKDVILAQIEVLDKVQ
jgi:Fic family protein